MKLLGLCYAVLVARIVVVLLVFKWAKTSVFLLARRGLGKHRVIVRGHQDDS